MTKMGQLSEHGRGTGRAGLASVKRGESGAGPQYTVIWSGTLHRQDEATHSLTGEGWQQKEAPLQKAGVKRNELPTHKEMHAKGMPADMGWRTSARVEYRSCRQCGRNRPVGTFNRHRICTPCQQKAA